VPANLFPFVTILHLSHHNNWLFVLKKSCRHQSICGTCDAGAGVCVCASATGGRELGDKSHRPFARQAGVIQIHQTQTTPTSDVDTFKEK